MATHAPFATSSRTFAGAGSGSSNAAGSGHAAPTAAQPASSDQLNALSWVHEELRRSLELAHKALRRQLKEAETASRSEVDAVDPAVLRAAKVHLHHCVGALQMIGLPAAATALHGAEALVQKMVAKPALVKLAAVDAVERVSFALLDYLGRLLAGKPVSAVMLFPQYQAALQLAGADRVHPADLWPLSKVGRELPADPSGTPRAADDEARSAMEALVLGLMREPGKAAYVRIGDLCADLGAGARQAGAQAALADLWQTAAAMFEALANGWLAADVHTKKMASRLLAQLRMSARGQPGVTERLAHELLFFCSHAKAGTGAGTGAGAAGAADRQQQAVPRLAAVRRAWQLEQLPTADYVVSRLGLFDPAVVAQAKRRVTAAKDTWSAVAGAELHRLPGLVEQFALVGESLHKLFPGGEQLSQALARTASQTQAGEAAPGPMLAMEVATALLYIEAALEDGELDHPDLAERVQHLANRIDGVRTGAEPRPLELWMEDLYRRVSDRQTMGSVVQELRASLSEVEKLIDQYFRNPADRAVLIPVPAQLSSMRGVLSVLGLDQASQAAVHMRDDVDALAQTEVDPQQAIQTGTFNRLADNLGALSFLIDMLSVQPQMAKSLFKFDAEEGCLRAVMGQTGRISAFAELDEAPAARTDFADATWDVKGFELEEATPPAAPQASLPATESAAQPSQPAVEPAEVLPLSEELQWLATEAAKAGVSDDEIIRRLQKVHLLALTQAQAALAAHLAQTQSGLRDSVDPATSQALRAELRQFLQSAPGSDAQPTAAPTGEPTAAPTAEPTAAVADTVASSGLEDDPEMREVFLEESLEVIAQARAALQRLAQAADSAADVVIVRRSFHTLKGSSRMVGLRDFGQAAWACEQLYNARLAQARPLDESTRQLSLQALDYLQGWTDAIAGQTPVMHHSAPVVQAADAMRLHAEFQPIAGLVSGPPTRSLTGPPEAAAPSLEPGSETVAQPSAEAAAPAALDMAFGAPVSTTASAPVSAPAKSALQDLLPELPSAADLDLGGDLSRQPAPLPEPQVTELELADLESEAAGLQPPFASTTAAWAPVAPAVQPLEKIDFDFDFELEDRRLPLGQPMAPMAAEAEAEASTDGAPAQALSSAADVAQQPGADDAISAAAADELLAQELAELDAFFGFTPDVNARFGLPTLPGELDGSPAGAAQGEAAAGSSQLLDQLVKSELTPAGAPALSGLQAFGETMPATYKPLDELELDLEVGVDETPSTLFETVAPSADWERTISVPHVSEVRLKSEPEGQHQGLDLPDAPAPEFAFESDWRAVDLNLELEHELELELEPEIEGTAPGAAQPPVESAAGAEAELAAHVLAAEEEPVKLVGPLRIPIPLFNIFLNESDEQSRRLCTELAEWSLEWQLEPLPESSTALAHSLAGNSGTVGGIDLCTLARSLEHALLRSQAVGYGRQGEAELFCEAAEEIRRLLHQFAAGFLREVSPLLLERLAAHERWPVPAATETSAAPLAAEEEAEAMVMQQDAAAAAQAYRELPEPEPEFEFESEAQAQQEAQDTQVTSEFAPTAMGDELQPAIAPKGGGFRAFGTESPVEPAEPALHLIRTGARADAFDDDADIDAVDSIDAELFPLFEEEAEELLPQLQSRLRDWLHQPADANAPAACMRTLHTFKGGARLAGAMRLGEMAHRLETAIEHMMARPSRRVSDIEPLLARGDAMASEFDALRRRPQQRAPEAEARAAISADAAALVQPGVPGRPDELAKAGQSVAVVVPEAAPATELSQFKAAAFSDPASGPPTEPGPEPGPEPGTEPGAGAALAPHASIGAPAAVLDPAAAAVAKPGADTPDAAAAEPATANQPTPAVAIPWHRFSLDMLPAAAEDERPTTANTAVRVRAGLLDRLVNQAGEVSITRSRIDADVKQLQSALGELSDSLERMRRQLRDIEMQAETQINSRLEAAKVAAESFDPLEMDRFTRFQELTRFMAESVNDVATLQRGLQRTLQSTEDALAAQARLTRELQDSLLRTRMVEFESNADRLYRTVRQAAKDSGKSVKLDIVGGAIEVDRGVLDRMNGPFEHLLRNCVAHGIEPSAARERDGKPGVGRIGVAVAQAGNEISVTVEDDGAGLDLQRIRQRAVERGLLAWDAEPSAEALAQLIFEPGFSTVDVVTELSGRGVGLDVVRAEVMAMGGRIETQSEAGRGTQFKLHLPLTTAVTQVVMLRCGEARVAVPTTLIETVLRVPSDEVQRSYGSGVQAYMGEQVPFFWLAALLRSGTRGDTTGRSQAVVIIRSALQRVAVHVDEVERNQEVVVKNVGPQLARVPGLAGVTLLPSGQVALIYNPVALANVHGALARAHMLDVPTEGAQARHAGKGERAAQAAAALPPLVMVVDDSLTVRRVTQRLLVREGYRVVTAKDGADALQQLAQERPVVVLSDIEMPQMDGFELLRKLRADPETAGLPVVMITSRTAQRHRDHAQELGADHYLGKPYAEDELLGLVAGFVASAVAR